MALSKISRTPVEASGESISSDALLFCDRAGITSDLETAIAIARRCFSVIGTPVVHLLEDPDLEDAHYVVIEIQVRGGVKDNVCAHRQFAVETSKELGASREFIRLNYDMI